MSTAAHVRLVPTCAVVVFAACTGRGHAPVDDSATFAVPAITNATVTCDEASARWTFSVTADAWTGNGQVVLSTDGDYVEKHPMYSQSAAADGTQDKLSLTLSVVPDWRDVSLGSTTVFNCDAADLTGILRVWTRDGDAQADCRAFGASPERWDEWSAGVSCATVLEDAR